MAKNIFKGLVTILILISYTKLFASPNDLTWEQLSKEQKNLIDAAIKSQSSAYAPYSKYKVGAALLDQSGQIFTGFNVENASYGLAMCAERTALFNALTSGKKTYQAIAVITKNSGMPCGACRQTLNEFAPDLTVLVSNPDKTKIYQTTLSELLPNSFGPKQLEE